MSDTRCKRRTGPAAALDGSCPGCGHLWHHHPAREAAKHSVCLHCTLDTLGDTTVHIEVARPNVDALLSEVLGEVNREMGGDLARLEGSAGLPSGTLAIQVTPTGPGVEPNAEVGELLASLRAAHQPDQWGDCPGCGMAGNEEARTAEDCPVIQAVRRYEMRMNARG